MNTPVKTQEKASVKAAQPTKNKLANHFYVEGRKDGPPRGDTAEEYVHVWEGKEDDAHDRTPEWRKAYAESMLNKCRKLYPDVTFSLIHVDSEGNETDTNL